MPSPFEISTRLVDDLASAYPTLATVLGIPGHDHEWPDLSPEGHDRRAEILRRHRDDLELHLHSEDTADRQEAMVIAGWIDGRLDSHAGGDHLRDLNGIASPFEDVRSIFDLAPTATAEDWEAICIRLETVDAVLDGYARSLDEGLRVGDPVARRQVEEVLDQAGVLAGPGSAWAGLADRLVESGHPGLDGRLQAAIDAGRAAAASFARFLRDDYLSRAAPRDGVGRDRYLRAAEQFLGMPIGPEEAYDWGWDEIARLRAEMARVGNEVVPGGSIAQVARVLETDPGRAASTPEAFRAFVQHRLDEAVERLDGVHFDVDPRIRALDVRLAPPGGSLAAYYQPPSEDFTRPGSVWYPLAPGQASVPLYQEVSTAYHEGFPGHHLQVATVMALGDRVSRARRALIWYSGSGEGWALYAERLMDELGFFERPEYRFGMLASQLFRACRVVVDIGSHLELRIPETAPILAGEAWDFGGAVRMMEEIGLQSHDVAVSEVTRYLGWPGQAISYKLGEREILRIRDRARLAAGDRFDLKAFHSRLLAAGAIRLDMLDDFLAEAV